MPNKNKLLLIGIIGILLVGGFSFSIISASDSEINKNDMILGYNANSLQNEKMDTWKNLFPETYSRFFRMKN